MSRVYLVRHGQAGTRKQYDALSDLGRRQSRLLGEHFAQQGIRFTAAYSGSLARQAQTADEVRSAYTETGGEFPQIAEHPGWNEFDLADVFRALAPQLCAEDDDFARDYQELVTAARAAADQHDAAVNRRWSPCDIKVVEAWLHNRYSYEGESWADFHRRVAACREHLTDAAHEDSILVFTSATPVAIWTGLSMDICDARVMRLAGALHNASCTVLRLTGSELRLHSFNGTPHLATPDLRTYR